ncbi:hypothetical protein PT2222_100088 [Paraburkholderia tropica]
MACHPGSLLSVLRFHGRRRARAAHGNARRAVLHRGESVGAPAVRNPLRSQRLRGGSADTLKLFVFQMLTTSHRVSGQGRGNGKSMD